MDTTQDCVISYLINNSLNIGQKGVKTSKKPIKQVWYADYAAGGGKITHLSG